MISRHYTDKNRSDLKPVVHFLALKTRLDPKQKTWNKCWTLTSPLCVRFPPLWLSTPPLIDFTCSPLPHVEIVLGRFPICVLLLTCVLVSLWNVISCCQSTVPIHKFAFRQEQLKFPDVFLTRPFTEDTSVGNLYELRSTCIPTFISAFNDGWISST